jgi:hypothetical protein
MLTRIRIEVSGEDSAAATSEALARYEHALQVVEAERHGKLRMGDARGEETQQFDGSDGAPPAELVTAAQVAPNWNTPVVDRGFYNSELGREVTDEVIEYDASLPGYKGRRVVCFRRLDTRGAKDGETTPHPQATEGVSSGTVTFKGSVGVY